MLGQLGAVPDFGSVDLESEEALDDLFVAMLHSRTIEDRLIDRFDLRGLLGAAEYQRRERELADHHEEVAREGFDLYLHRDRDPERRLDLRTRMWISCMS